MIRKAVLMDIPQIHNRINALSSKGPVLPRARSELYEFLRDYWVYCDRSSERILGFCSLHVFWENAAEIRSLVVEEDVRGRAIGEMLVRACFEEAKELGVSHIYILTNIPEYCEKFGFVEIEKSSMPQKIWADCLKCQKFPDCDEVAMSIDIGTERL
jgi:amino-acid N-acetyltransferase